MAFIKQDTYLTLFEDAPIQFSRPLVKIKAFDLANADLEEDLEWEKYFAMERARQLRRLGVHVDATHLGDGLAVIASSDSH